MTDQAFTSTAAFYALFSDSAARLDREGPFLTGLIQNIDMPRVADIACGTGLHAALFAEAGAQVDAFDLSAGMIAEARKSHPHKHITYRAADMRNITGGPWDLVVCLGNSLSLLGGEKDIVRTFESVARCLAPGGRFLTQTLNYDRPAAREPRHNVRTAATDDGEVVAVKNLVPHSGRTLLALTFFVPDGGGVRTVTDTAILHHLSQTSLDAAAAAAGLTSEAIYGGHDRRPFDPAASPDLMCLFVK